MFCPYFFSSGRPSLFIPITRKTTTLQTVLKSQNPPWDLFVRQPHSKILSTQLVRLHRHCVSRHSPSTQALSRSFYFLFSVWTCQSNYANLQPPTKHGKEKREKTRTPNSHTHTHAQAQAHNRKFFERNDSSNGNKMNGKTVAKRTKSSEYSINCYDCEVPIAMYFKNSIQITFLSQFIMYCCRQSAQRQNNNNNDEKRVIERERTTYSFLFEFDMRAEVGIDRPMKCINNNNNSECFGAQLAVNVGEHVSFLRSK